MWEVHKSTTDSKYRSKIELNRSLVKLSEQRIRRNKAAKDISDSFDKRKQYSVTGRKVGHIGEKKSRVLGDNSGAFALESKSLFYRDRILYEDRFEQDIWTYMYAAMSMLSMRKVRMKISKSEKSEDRLTRWLKINVSLISRSSYENGPEENIQKTR